MGRGPNPLDIIMLAFIHKIEKSIIYALLGMMTLVVLIETIELGWIIVKDIISPPFLLLEVHEIMEIFGFFSPGSHRSGTARIHPCLSD